MRGNADITIKKERLIALRIAPPIILLFIVFSPTTEPVSIILRTVFFLKREKRIKLTECDGPDCIIFGLK